MHSDHNGADDLSMNTFGPTYWMASFKMSLGGNCCQEQMEHPVHPLISLFIDELLVSDVQQFWGFDNHPHYSGYCIEIIMERTNFNEYF